MLRYGTKLVCPENPAAVGFFLGIPFSVVKTAQKKEGRGETTWGDNKKGVVNRR